MKAAPRLPVLDTNQGRSRGRLHMRLSRQQLSATTHALANPAQAAAWTDRTVQAQKADGFDPHWLQIAVLAPLHEANVDVGM